MSSYNAGPLKQDMPPPGGYEEIHYARIPAKRILSYKTFFAGSLILSAYSIFYYTRRHRYIHQMTAEYYDHVIAVEPLIQAESDRAFLRQLRHNRNVERDLMKNVPDWKVGTLWGAKLFKTVPEDAIPNVSVQEFYGHRAITETKDYFRPHTHVGLEEQTVNALY